MAIDDKLTASLEDYLEAIFYIIAEKQAVRPKDIAKRLRVSNASVTGALRSLAEKRLINYAPYEVISLTTDGKAAARDVVRRHEVLRDFFVNVLAVAEADADEAACKMEHSIPKTILDRFIQFAEFADVCPRGGSKLISGFGRYCDQGDTQESCEQCISVTLQELKQKKAQRGTRSMTIAKLKDLAQGQKGRIIKTGNRGQTAKRIIEMGVTPGAVVQVERMATSENPMDIKIKGYHLSLRKDDADKIQVEIL
jgi:DtxR family transcriptional regulator, Mn-dependent transcriptional regulator